MEKTNEGLKVPGVIGRRTALQVIGVGLGAASGLLVLDGCKSGGDSGGAASGGGAAAPKAPTSCAEKIEVDDTAKALRKTLQYMEKSNAPDKKCSTCAQFDAGKYGECGGCKLFAGAVNPEGLCLSYAPKPAPGAAPAAPGAPAAAPAVPGKTG